MTPTYVFNVCWHLQERYLNNMHWIFLSCSLKDEIMKDFIFNLFISVQFVTSMYHFIMTNYTVFKAYTFSVGSSRFEA